MKNLPIQNQLTAGCGIKRSRVQAPIVFDINIRSNGPDIGYVFLLKYSLINKAWRHLKTNNYIENIPLPYRQIYIKSRLISHTLATLYFRHTLKTLCQLSIGEEK